MIDVEAVKHSVSLVELIGRTVALRRHGDEWWGLCPFHHEKTPSLHVSPAKGLYYCFGCGEAGDCIDWTMRAEGVSFQAAAEKLAGGKHIDAAELKKRRDERRAAAEAAEDERRGTWPYFYLRAAWEREQAGRLVPETLLLAERVRRFWGGSPWPSR